MTCSIVLLVCYILSEFKSCPIYQLNNQILSWTSAQSKTGDYEIHVVNLLCHATVIQSTLLCILSTSFCFFTLFTVTQCKFMLYVPTLSIPKTTQSNLVWKKCKNILRSWKKEKKTLNKKFGKRPFLSSKYCHFHKKAEYKTFLVEMTFIGIANHFHIRGASHLASLWNRDLGQLYMAYPLKRMYSPDFFQTWPNNY